MYRIPILLSLILKARTRAPKRILSDAATIFVRPSKAYDLPKHLQVEIITSCNLACTMCPRTVALTYASSDELRSAWQRRMPFEQFCRIIDQFPRLESLSLHGIGEPLLHGQLIEMVKTAADRGIQVRFITNATLLSPSKSERLIDAGLHRVIISLDGATPSTFDAIRIGANFEGVVHNIDTLVKARARHNCRFPIIDINMVVTTCNYSEVPKLLDLADKLGVDSVIIGPMSPPTPALNELVCDSVIWAKLTRSASRQARTLGLNLHIRGRKYSAEHQQKPQRKKTYQCLHPWFSAVITIEGDIMPCCNIHNSSCSMGNVFDSDFGGHWNDFEYSVFRNELNQKNHVPEPCLWCPDF